ncbi:MAG: hypothetical protein H6678_10150 [Candidatus Delongbacteria bacterium]|nr:hypothetical protein [Candidatus Delongbacteria bacterium]
MRDHPSDLWASDRNRTGSGPAHRGARHVLVRVLRDCHLKDINHAFANIDGGSDTLIPGEICADTDTWFPEDSWDVYSLRGSHHQRQLLKVEHAYLKTQNSVGGWSGSAHFWDEALSTQSRSRFAASCVDFINQGFYVSCWGPANAGTRENGVVDHRDMEQNRIGMNGCLEFWAEDARLPWHRNPSIQRMISYDARSIREKGAFITAPDLGGARA